MTLNKRHVGSAARHAALSALGQRLRTARKHARITQQAAGEHLGVRTQTLRNWEAGRNEPEHSRLRALASLYGLHPDHFTTDTQPSPPPSTLYRPGLRINVDPSLLVRARKDAGLSQAETARRSGVGISSIRRYEQGNARPTRAALSRLALIYGKSPSWPDPEPPGGAALVEISRMDDALRAYLELQPDLTPCSVKAIAKFTVFIHQQQATENHQQETCSPLP